MCRKVVDRNGRIELSPVRTLPHCLDFTCLRILDIFLIVLDIEDLTSKQHHLPCLIVCDLDVIELSVLVMLGVTLS